jgi:hypothetical protein
VSARLWLRVLAGVEVFFTLGHTIGTMFPATDTPAELSLIAAMKAPQFHVMGFDRTYWEFYRGFSLTVSVHMAVLALMAWQLGTLSRDHPRQALPLTIAQLIAAVGTAVICWMYFFWAPILTSMAMVLCAALAVIALQKESVAKSGKMTTAG